MALRRCDEGMNTVHSAATALRRMNITELQGHRSAVTIENRSVHMLCVRRDNFAFHAQRSCVAVTTSTFKWKESLASDSEQLWLARWRKPRPFLKSRYRLLFLLQGRAVYLYFKRRRSLPGNELMTLL
jgi:hypothetical protein